MPSKPTETKRDRHNRLRRELEEARVSPTGRLIASMQAQRETEARYGKHLTIEQRLERLELRDQENWNLMTAVLSDHLTEALDETDADADSAESDLPAITDKASFVDYVSMTARFIKEERLTASQGRGLLYAAQLAYAALQRGEPHATQDEPMRQLP